MKVKTGGQGNQYNLSFKDKQKRKTKYEKPKSTCKYQRTTRY